MKLRLASSAAALGILLTGCSNLGLGEADCTPPARGVSSANMLTVQAVPQARYTPCVNEIRLGWDSVQWFAENGRAGVELIAEVGTFDTIAKFLTATVTAECDVGGATRVPSGYPDIERYEAVTWQSPDVGITIVPSGSAPLMVARRLADRLRDTQLDDRPVDFDIDDALDESVRDRLDRALAAGRYVWILDELAADEDTVELRSNDPRVGASGLSPEDALDEIEDELPEVFYRGFWYFTFEGGCITYEFNAEGRIAETVAEDAEDALGFYPAHELRAIAESAGYELIVEDSP